MTKKPPNYLYFIKSYKFVKIGITSDPQKRIKSIQTGCPTHCYYLAIFDCGRQAKDYEYKLHKIFEHRHSHGEWFLCGEEIDNFVKKSIENENLRHNMWEETFNRIHYAIGDENINNNVPSFSVGDYLNEIKYYRPKEAV